MQSINSMRALLVAGAAVAFVLAAAQQMWTAAAVLGVGIAAHGALWLRLHRGGPQRAAVRGAIEDAGAD